MEHLLVVGVDGSEPGHRAVGWAADEAARCGLPLRLVHASLRGHGSVVEGPVREIVLDRSAAADLLIVDARLRYGHFGRQLGRVGQAAPHRADRPLVILPWHR
nr:universal stress protein [Streptomyces albicerus]